VTLEERIRWVLAQQGWIQRDWGPAAGLSESYVGRLLNRLQEDSDASLNADAAAALAKAAGVTTDWLTTGEGKPVPEAETPLVRRPVYRYLENWAHAVIDACRRWPWLRKYPSVLEAAGETSALLIAGPATAELVLKTVNLLLETGDPDRIEEAEEKRVDAEIAAEESRYGRALLLRKEIEDRGEAPPPLKVLIAQVAKAEKSTARRKPRGANDAPPKPSNDTAAQPKRTGARTASTRGSDTVDGGTSTAPKKKRGR